MQIYILYFSQPNVYAYPESAHTLHWAKELLGMSVLLKYTNDFSSPNSSSNVESS